MIRTRHASGRRRRRRRTPWNGLIGAFMLALVVIAVLVAPLSAFDPNRGSLRERLEPPSRTHLLGTDQFGRDVATRLLYGGRSSLAVGLGVVFCAMLVGTLAGATSTYFGGAADAVVMRIMDILLSIPGILFAMALVAVRGPGFSNVILAVSVLYIPHFARMMRSRVLSIKQFAYVEAVRASGSRSARIIQRHVIPNAIGPVIALASLITGEAILVGASLGFLGIGVPLPTPEWGNMLSESREVLYQAPWLAVAPGLAITITVLGFNLVGDWLRDRFDPALR